MAAKFVTAGTMRQPSPSLIGSRLSMRAKRISSVVGSRPLNAAARSPRSSATVRWRVTVLDTLAALRQADDLGALAPLGRRDDLPDALDGLLQGVIA